MRHCCIPSGCSCGPDLAWRASKPQGSWCAQTADACGCTHGTGPCPAPAKPICHPARCALGMPASPSAAVPAVEGSPLLPSRCWCSESASQLWHLCLQALSSTVSAEMHFYLVAWVSLLPGSHCCLFVYVRGIRCVAQHANSPVMGKARLFHPLQLYREHATQGIVHTCIQVLCDCTQEVPQNSNVCTALGKGMYLEVGQQLYKELVGILLSATCPVLLLQSTDTQL